MKFGDIGNYDDKRIQIKMKIEQYVKQKEQEKLEQLQKNDKVGVDNENQKLLEMKSDYITYKNKILSDISLKFKYKL